MRNVVISQSIFQGLSDGISHQDRGFDCGDSKLYILRRRGWRWGRRGLNLWSVEGGWGEEEEEEGEGWAGLGVEELRE